MFCDPRSNMTRTLEPSQDWHDEFWQATSLPLAKCLYESRVVVRNARWHPRVLFKQTYHLWSMLQWTGLWVWCTKTGPTLCIVIHFLVFIFIQIVSCVRYGFRSRCTLPQEYRAEQLRALWKMIEENGEKLFQALWQDLHKVRRNTLCPFYLSFSPVK